MKKILIVTAITALLGLMSCTGPGGGAGLIDDEGTLLPWEGATTSLTVINNTGYDITFYVGDLIEDDEAASDYYSKIALLDGEQETIPNVPCGLELNFWYAHVYSEYYTSYSYCTVGGILGKFVFDSAHSYSFTYPTSYSYSIKDETDTALLGDWDIIISNSRSFFETNQPTQYLLGPQINILNSTEWDCMSAWFTSYSVSSMYGLTKFHYTGTATRDFIRIYYRYKDDEGTRLFFNTGFIFQTHTMGCLPEFNNNSFVTSTWDIGYENIIEILSDYDVVLADIDQIDVIIEGDTTTYKDPLGLLSFNGSTTEDSNYFYQPIINNGVGTVREIFSMAILTDSSGRQVHWEWPSVYQFNGSEWEYNNIVPQDATGRLQIYRDDLSSYGETYSLYEICLSWNPYTAAGDSESLSNSYLQLLTEDPTLQQVDRDRALYNCIDERERELFQSLFPEKIYYDRGF